MVDFVDIEDLASFVARAKPGSPRVIIGVDGPGGSGKSTFAGRLASFLADASVVHTDDFYLPSAERSLTDSVGAAYDLARLEREVLAPAIRGIDSVYSVYDWVQDKIRGSVVIGAEAPIIVEGVYSLTGRLRSYYSYSIFCTADRQVRLRRGIERDGEEMRATWEDVWMPAEDRYIAAESPDLFSDLVVDSSRGPEDELLFAKP